MTDRPAILALDQAADSGWAIHDGYSVGWWGLAKNATDRREVIKTAFHTATSRERDLLVVYEDHSAIPASRKRNTSTILGMGDARGRWLEQLELAGHPMTWTLKVTPDDWRAMTIGTGGGTEAIKIRARNWASAKLGRRIEDHNTAEAVVMAHWGALDGVARFFGARQLAKVKARARREKARAE